MNSLVNELFGNKKLRRSERLELKEKTQLQSKTNSDANRLDSPCKCSCKEWESTGSPTNGEFGRSKQSAYFENLPLEIKFHIFPYLTVPELSILTITSKTLRNNVVMYKSSTRGHRNTEPYAISHCNPPAMDKHFLYLEQFRNLGLLVKRATCLYATRDRLKFIEELLKTHLCYVHKLCDQPLRCVSLLACGKFFHTMIAGWDEKECGKVFEAACQVTCMDRHLNTILKHTHGLYQGIEIHVRLFYRRVFVNPCQTNHDQAFWLSLILKKYPMVHQAKILFLLFGPLSEEDVQWHEMCESTPVTESQARSCFGDLARAFRVLHEYSAEWNEDDIISVMEELTSSPNEWLSENVANLLYMCGENITIKVLSSKAINGRMAELASLITSLSLVCIRYDHTIKLVIKLITSLCSVFEKARERQTFLHSIVDMFREVMLDIHEYSDGDEDLSQDMVLMLDANAEFTKELVAWAFKEHGICNGSISAKAQNTMKSKSLEE